MTSIVNFWSTWQHAHKALEPDAAWLGEAGWTVPMWADPRIMRRLKKASGDLDSAFVRYYTTRGGVNLTTLWGRLLASPGLRPWRRLLCEAVESYKDNRYAVVLPSLLLILEGAVVAGAKGLKRKIDPKNSAGRMRKDSKAEMRRLVWVSIEAFLKPVFSSASFHARRPITLNRHWVMHGRAATKWGCRRECVRLFHALDTVITTVDVIPEVRSAAADRQAARIGSGLS